MAMEPLDIGRDVDDLKIALGKQAAKKKGYNLFFGQVEDFGSVTKKATMVDEIEGGYKVYNTSPMFFNFWWVSEYVADITIIGTQAFIKFRFKKDMASLFVAAPAILVFMVVLLLRSGQPLLCLIVASLPIFTYFMFRRRLRRFKKLILNFLKTI